MKPYMGIWRHPHGVYYARKKVPDRLVQEVGKAWLKQSLRTKDIRLANVLAKPVLAEFDRILARAEPVSEGTTPPTTVLDAKLIKRIADHHYASVLAEDDRIRRSGTGSQALFNNLTKQLKDAGVAFQSPFRVETPEFGLSDRELEHDKDTLAVVLPGARSALARGDISIIGEELDELLAVFRLNVARGGAAYRELGYGVLKAHVRGLEALAERHRGQVVETPPIPVTADDTRGACNVPIPEHSGNKATLRDAFEGWQKAKTRPVSTVKEFDRAIRLFEELHGILPLTAITRTHVRRYREALQKLPVRCETLAEGERRSDDAPHMKPKTINKLLSGPQAMWAWGKKNGLLPEDVSLSNPFDGMTLEEDTSTREPWDISELRTLFASPVFTKGHRPEGGSGEAAFWLPLLGIFTGARLGELASLARSDVITDEQTGVAYLKIVEDEARGRRIKTTSSRRAVPVHSELIRLGFLSKVVEPATGQLFPLIEPGFKDGYGEKWSKWFGRYIRSIGITNRASVFHSFRHGFKDALRAAGVSEDVNDALTGHAGVGGVGRKYGAKEMMRRFGLPRLADAVAQVAYPGLDLEHLLIADQK